jgi:hypothetical protein
VAAVLDEVAAALGDLRRVAAVLDEVATAEPLGQACGSDVVGSLGAARAHGDKVCGRVRAAPFLGRRTRSMKNRYEYGSRHWRVFFFVTFSPILIIGLQMERFWRQPYSECRTLIMTQHRP